MFVSVYINGIFYGKEIDRYEQEGVIELKKRNNTNEEDPIDNLGKDPIHEYFRTNEAAHRKYVEKYGKEYIAQRPKDYITIEWR